MHVFLLELSVRYSNKLFNEDLMLRTFKLPGHLALISSPPVFQIYNSLLIEIPEVLHSDTEKRNRCSRPLPKSPRTGGWWRKPEISY